MSNSFSSWPSPEPRFSTPILLLLFNRSDNASRLIDALSLLKPAILYVNIDAPRGGNKGDTKEVALCKKLVGKIDWECTIYRQYHKRNLGCKLSVVSGINWFFDNCEEGIILEDDCIPSLSFFQFSSKMLYQYRHDDRVMQISGSNFVATNKSPLNTYYFSALNDIWGWATWKRAWSKFSLDMTGLDEFLDQGLLETYTGNPEISKWLRAYLISAKNPHCTTWSSQWTYAMLKNFAFSLVPPINLVHNIGFTGQGGTHASFSSFKVYASFVAEDSNCFEPPQFFAPNRKLDSIRFALIKNTDPIFSLRSKMSAFAKRLMPDVAWRFLGYFKRM